MDVVVTITTILAMATIITMVAVLETKTKISIISTIKIIKTIKQIRTMKLFLINPGTARRTQSEHQNATWNNSQNQPNAYYMHNK
jgi:hypothetical protein